MTETQEIDAAPEAKTTKMRGGDGVHDKWALHAFAFEQQSGWMPANLRCYHEGRIMNGELMEGYYDEFIPVTYDTERGAIVKKEVEEKTVVCDECGVPAKKYDDDTFCPKCGLLCSEAVSDDNLVRDPKAAGRMPEN